MEEQDNSDYEALLQAGQQNAAYQRQLEQQKALAERLRSGPALQGQMVSGHYVAPNILEVINDVRRARAGADADKAAQTAGAGLEGSMTKQNQLVLARLLRGQQQPTNPALMGPQPGPNYVTPAMRTAAEQEGLKGY
jgi:hypothetical protein